MTFREILTALWRRAWIIVLVTVIAAFVAVIYMQRMTPNFESSTSLRISPVMTAALNSGTLAGLPVDVDPSIATTATVLKPAAASLKVPASSLNGAISSSIAEGATTTTTVVIAATGSESRQSQQRAKAVATAYTDYLDTTVQDTLAALQTQLQDATDTARNYQGQLEKEPLDQLAQTNLTTALSQVNTLNIAIAGLQTAGPAASITSVAYPGASTNPSSLTVAGIALLCGLLAGMGLALIRDRMDDRLHGAEEIERITGTHALGVLTNDRSVARKRALLPAGGGKQRALSEGIRSLRTTLQVLLPGGRGVVAVTSVEPGDGKTLVSANLALSWARAGRAVVLVAGDLRRPEVAGYFPDSTGGPGLGGLLSRCVIDKESLRTVDISASLQTTDFRNLRVLPAGDIVEEPADALASDHLARIIGHLSEVADIVVIDTPPALGLADASVLASHSDGVIVLTTANRTRRALLIRTLDTLAANGVTIFGAVVNRSRRRTPRSYSSYYSGGPEPREAQSRDHVPSTTSRSGTIAPNPAELDLPVAHMVAAPEPWHSTHDRILFVCTANECRSPFAEAIARSRARSLPVEFASAGIRASRGTAPKAALDHAAELGLDLGSHASMPVEYGQLRDYDLVLALSREHARSLLAESPDIAPRLFTVKQFARWIMSHERPPHRELGAWLDEQADSPRVADFLGASPTDDVDDPAGMPLKYWRAMSGELSEAIDEIIHGLYQHEVAQPRS